MYMSTTSAEPSVMYVLPPPSKYSLAVAGTPAPDDKKSNAVFPPATTRKSSAECSFMYVLLPPSKNRFLPDAIRILELNVLFPLVAVLDIFPLAFIVEAASVLFIVVVVALIVTFLLAAPMYVWSVEVVPKCKLACGLINNESEPATVSIVWFPLNCIVESNLATPVTLLVPFTSNLNDGDVSPICLLYTSPSPRD